MTANPPLPPIRRIIGNATDAAFVPAFTPSRKAIEFGDKVFGYVARTLEATRLPMAVSAPGVETRVYTLQGPDGKAGLNVHVTLTGDGVVAGIAYPGETVVKGAPQATDGTGDVGWRTFRFGYGDRFHVFGGGLKREIGDLLVLHHHGEVVDDPLAGIRGDLEEAVRALIALAPEQAPERIAAAMMTASSQDALDSIRLAITEAREDMLMSARAGGLTA